MKKSTPEHSSAVIPGRGDQMICLAVAAATLGMSIGINPDDVLADPKSVIPETERSATAAPNLRQVAAAEPNTAGKSSEGQGKTKAVSPQSGTIAPVRKPDAAFPKAERPGAAFPKSERPDAAFPKSERSVAGDVRKRISMNELPAAVKALAEKETKGSRIVGVEQMTKAVTVTYTVSYDQSGRNMVIVYGADGTVLSKGAK